ncbi:MAG: peptidase [Verrucomicrobia bacterium]|nr:peptidase [Verrucomicrobiota bacterium]
MGEGEPALPALQIAADILEERLRVQLREQLGVTYSPSVNLGRQPNVFQAIVANLSLPPSRAQEITELTIATANHLATAGVTVEEFERFRKIWRTRTEIPAAENDNAWWVNRLSRAQADPTTLARLRERHQVFVNLTHDSVNRAAEEFLVSARANYVITLPRNK